MPWYGILEALAAGTLGGVAVHVVVNLKWLTITIDKGTTVAEEVPGGTQPEARVGAANQRTVSARRPHVIQAPRIEQPADREGVELHREEPAAVAAGTASVAGPLVALPATDGPAAIEAGREP